jgi:hypothetical protein
VVGSVNIDSNRSILVSFLLWMTCFNWFTKALGQLVIACIPFYPFGVQKSKIYIFCLENARNPVSKLTGVIGFIHTHHSLFHSSSYYSLHPIVYWPTFTTSLHPSGVKEVFFDDLFFAHHHQDDVFACPHLFPYTYPLMYHYQLCIDVPPFL